MNFVGLIEPVDGPVLVTGVEIAMGDAIGTAILALFIPCRQDVRDAALRALVSGFRKATLESRQAFGVAGDPQSLVSQLLLAHTLDDVNVLKDSEREGQIRLQGERRPGRGEDVVVSPKVLQEDGAQPVVKRIHWVQLDSQLAVPKPLVRAP